MRTLCLLLFLLSASAAETTFTFSIIEIGDDEWVGITRSGDIGADTRPDIDIRRTDDGQQWRKISWNLGDGFVLGLSDHGKPSGPDDGIGLTFTRTGHDCFSWEWFEWAEEAYPKLQMQGAIRPSFSDHGDIASIAFPEATALRLSSQKDTEFKVTHLLLIYPGSILSTEQHDSAQSPSDTP